MITGLSPRVRGNPGGFTCWPPSLRSIPACTGKPCAWTVGGRTREVYPRVYGETVARVIMPDSKSGLSPRVRGNLLLLSGYCLLVRSIPACTGKPACRRDNDRRDRVYPRVYGETFAVTERSSSSIGLSPRVRGNRRWSVCRGPRHRSIPACTGKPRLAAARRPWPTVYPRVYGETGNVRKRDLQDLGLSPRVRGNPASRGSEGP